MDLITTIQESFERALLSRLPVEERFQIDVFLGDVSFETSYSLPGEEEPPRVRADISIDWPTWAQTAYRNWSIGDTPGEMPEAVLEVALRVQRLAEAPDTSRILSVLPAQGPLLGRDPLLRTATTIEEVRVDTGVDTAPAGVQWAVEATYEAVLRFDEPQLDDPTTLTPLTDALTRWLSSTLVQLADLPLAFTPPDPVGEG